MSKKTKKSVSIRNPLVVACKSMGKRVVKAKKGKGSYDRKKGW